MAKTLAVIESAIAALVDIERTSKNAVATLAVDCLDFLHEHGQVAVCNNMMFALSPANKKVVMQFFKEYSGFYIDKDHVMKKKIQPVRQADGTITKDAYADAKIAWTDFKEQGSSLWLWWAAQGKHEKAEAKPLDLNKVTKTVATFAEKAEKQGIKRLALFNALIGSVFDAEEVMAMLKELATPRASVTEQSKGVPQRVQVKEEEPALM